LILSQAGVGFFSSLHRAFDKGAGLALEDLNELFSTAAPGLPALWASGELDPATAIQLDATHISLRSWLALWRYAALFSALSLSVRVSLSLSLS
jgi:hypothetical protein